MLCNKSYLHYCLFVLAFFFAACKEKTYSQQPDKGNTCFIMKPVAGDSKLNEPLDFDFTGLTLNAVIDKMAVGKTAAFDSTMAFVTSFEYQKAIKLNYLCFKKLALPDSVFLMDIYRNSVNRTNPLISSIAFQGTYKKNIAGYGATIVYEYLLNDVPEVSPHHLYLLIKETENRTGADYEGFAICSDGLDWRTSNNNDVPLFVQQIRRGKDLYIPLIFQNDRFVPAGHLKKGVWPE